MRLAVPVLIFASLAQFAEGEDYQPLYTYEGREYITSGGGAQDLLMVPDADTDGVEDIAVLQSGDVTLVSGATGNILWDHEFSVRIRPAGQHLMESGDDIDGDGISDLYFVQEAALNREDCGCWFYATVLSGVDGTVLRDLTLDWDESTTGSNIVVTGLSTGPDLSGDGIRDLALTVSHHFPPVGREELYLFWNPIRQKFFRKHEIEGYTGGVLREDLVPLGDLTGDGLPELANHGWEVEEEAGHSDKTDFYIRDGATFEVIQILKNDPDRTRTYASVTDAFSYRDVDNSVLLAVAGRTANFYSGQIYILDWQTATIVDQFGHPEITEFAGFAGPDMRPIPDMTGDGIPELAALTMVGREEMELLVFKNVTNEVFARITFPYDLDAGFFSYIIGLSDITGDGRGHFGYFSNDGTLTVFRSQVAMPGPGAVMVGS